jgi:hypothetical protein
MWARLGAYQSGALYRAPLSRLLALPKKIRLEGKGMAFTKTLAYYVTAKITTVKCYGIGTYIL